MQHEYFHICQTAKVPFNRSDLVGAQPPTNGHVLVVSRRKWNHLECSTKFSSLGTLGSSSSEGLAFGWTHHSNTKDKALQVILADGKSWFKRTVVFFATTFREITQSVSFFTTFET